METKHDILIDGDDGEMEYVDVGRDRAGRVCAAEYLGEVPPEDPTRKALEIGLAVLKQSDGYTVGVIVRYGNGDGDNDYLDLQLVPIPPAPLVGAEYLRSLPVGTIWTYMPVSATPDHFVIIEGGICWFRQDSADHHRFWEWDGPDFQESAITERASPETCPPWSPEQ